MTDRRPKQRSGSKPEAKKTPRPRKKPANVKKAARAKTARARAAKKRSKGAVPGVRSATASVPLDPSATDDAETRFVQPYQATKAYRCPGCNREIPAGSGHVVAVPPDAPDLRRHWHRGCWNNRHNLA